MINSDDVRRLKDYLSGCSAICLSMVDVPDVMLELCEYWEDDASEEVIKTLRDELAAVKRKLRISEIELKRSKSPKEAPRPPHIAPPPAGSVRMGRPSVR